MESFREPPRQPVSRRKFLKSGLLATAGLGIYSTEVERHWVDLTRPYIYLKNLPPAFDGMRIVHLSDIHLNAYTEPFFLQHVVGIINKLQPDMVLFTGDYVSAMPFSIKHNLASAEQCGEILSEIHCPLRFASLGNHDVGVSAPLVTKALQKHGTPVLNNGYTAVERGNSRLWISGFADPVTSQVKLKSAVPLSIRNQPEEPVIALCHAPDFADSLMADPAGQAVSLMLSGHTHGGQVRLPIIGPLALPEWGRKYVHGWFHFGETQLYVNRGIGTVSMPLRFDCPPELTLHTLKRG